MSGDMQTTFNTRKVTEITYKGYQLKHSIQLVDNDDSKIIVYKTTPITIDDREVESLTAFFVNDEKVLETVKERIGSPYSKYEYDFGMVFPKIN